MTANDAAIHPGPSRAWNTALCLIPPPSLWPQLQRLRHTLDPVNAKWPPHINLSYPFTAADADLAQTAQRIQSAVAPLFSALTASHAPSHRLRIQLRTRTAPFIRGKVAKVSAEPLDPAPLVRLHDALHDAFPHFTRTARYGPYAPHLNVALAPWNPGQPKQTQAYLDEMMAAVKSVLESDQGSSLVEWEAFGLYVLLREDDTPFRFAAYVPFTADGDWQDPYSLVGSTWNSDLYAPDFSRMHSDMIGLGRACGEESGDAMAVDTAPLTSNASSVDTVPVWQGEQYPHIALPDRLASNPACDEAWARLPAFQFDTNADDWMPIQEHQLDADYAHTCTPCSLSVLTYNVFNDRHNPCTPQRLPRIVAELERQHHAGVSIINLQECTPDFLVHLLAAPWVREHYSVTHTLDWATATFPHVGSPVTLVRGPTAFAHMHVRYSGAKSSLCLQIPSWRVMVANVHLTSSHSSNGNDSASRRNAQMEPIGRLAKRHAPPDWLVVVAGDFNTPSTKDEDHVLLGRHGLVDSVHVLGGKCLPTFNPAENALAGYSASPPVAIDRVVVRSHHTTWTPVNQGLVGTEDPASDHYGLLVTFMANGHAVSPTPPPFSHMLSDKVLRQHLYTSNPDEFESLDHLHLRSNALDSVAAFCTRALSHLPYARHLPTLIPIDLVRLGLARPSDVTQAVWFVDMEPKAALGHLAYFRPPPMGSDAMLVEQPVRMVGHSPCPWSPSTGITIHFQTAGNQLVDVHVVDPGVHIHTLAPDLLLNADTRSGHWPVSHLKRGVTCALQPVRDANDMLAHLHTYPSLGLAFRVLRLWAERAGVLAPAWSASAAHLTPMALLVLVLRSALVLPPNASAARLVRAFFSDYAQISFVSLAIAPDRYPTTRVSASSVAMVVESLARPGLNLAANVTRSARDAFVDAVTRQHASDHVLSMFQEPREGWDTFVCGYPEFVVVTVGWDVDLPAGSGVPLAMVKQVTIPWAKIMSSVEKERDHMGAQVRLWPAPCCSTTQASEVHFVMGIRCARGGSASVITSKVASTVQSAMGTMTAGSAMCWNHVRRLSRQALAEEVDVDGYFFSSE